MLPPAGIGAVSDPLLDLPEPRHEPDALTGISTAQAAAQERLQARASTAEADFGNTVGEQWKGTAAESAMDSGTRLVSGYLRAGRSAERVAACLSECASRWRDAHQMYGRARRLADVAVSEETHHRWLGGTRAADAVTENDLSGEHRFGAMASGADGWVSGARGQARSLAQHAIEVYRAAGVAAAAELRSVANGLGAQPRTRRAPANSDTPWWRDVARGFGDGVEDTWDGMKAGAGRVADFGQYAVENPSESAAVAGDVGLMGLGVLGVAVGTGGELGGVALDATGVGAVVGVPAAVASGALIATSGATSATGAAKAGLDLKTMWSKSKNAKASTEPKPERIQNTVTRQLSPQWNKLKPYSGKTRSNGLVGKRQRFYEWDRTHNDIEVYDKQRNHIGTMDAVTGEMRPNKVVGRDIK